MNALVSFVLGGGVGLGVLLVAFGIAGKRVLPERRAGGNGRRSELLVVRVALAVAAGLAVYGITGWLVGGLLAAMAAWVAPRLVTGRAAYKTEIEMVEAIASWAEMLRDTIAAAAGLEQAIAATGPIAPAPLASPVARLAVSLEFEPLPVALRRFADDVDHPTCDFVVAALVTAAEKQAREIGPLLTQLAECARDEAKMRSRIWVDRARTRTSVNVIAACVVLFAGGLIAFSREYLKPYDTVTGQVVLIGIGAVFAASFVVMDRMGRVDVPERFIARRSA
jgi:Flp pilus assembly protein TadB